MEHKRAASKVSYTSQLQKKKHEEPKKPRNDNSKNTTQVDKKYPETSEKIQFISSQRLRDEKNPETNAAQFLDLGSHDLDSELGNQKISTVSSIFDQSKRN